MQEEYPEPVTSEDAGFQGIQEPEARCEVFKATVPMTPSQFAQVFLSDTATLRFEELLERQNCQAVPRKPWKDLEDGKLHARNLDYLAPPPVTWKQELVHVQTTQFYQLLSGILVLKCTTKYMDFDPLSSTIVEQNWIVRDVALGKAAVTVSLSYRDKALKADSDLDLAVRGHLRAFSELWYSEAKRRNLFVEKVGPEIAHSVAKYEDVNLETRINLPQITAVYKNLAIYINSGLLVVLLAYLVYLHFLLETRMKDPNCFS